MKQTPWCEQVIEAMLYFLWDLGLKVGQSSRSLDEVVRMARKELKPELQNMRKAITSHRSEIAALKREVKSLTSQLKVTQRKTKVGGGATPSDQPKVSKRAAREEFVFAPEMLVQMRNAGVAVLVISEELEELFEICDRIQVLHKGALSPSLDPRRTKPEEIGRWMIGAAEVAA